ncbi:MAG: hypothetical protein Ct9H300mP28_36600 [Pseudomonadota bacterium]|nr:MAG: hypothetical protein Ct9H300mP28_36600 [Pseudomonadota bacterium]
MLVIEPMPVHPAAVLTRGNFKHRQTKSSHSSERSLMLFMKKELCPSALYMLDSMEMLTTHFMQTGRLPGCQVTMILTAAMR